MEEGREDRWDDNFRECTALHCSANDTNYPLNLLCKLCDAIVKAEPEPFCRSFLSLHPAPSAVAASRVCGEAIQTIAGIIIMVESREKRGTIWDKALGRLLNELKTLQSDGKVGAVQGAWYERRPKFDGTRLGPNRSQVGSPFYLQLQNEENLTKFKVVSGSSLNSPRRTIKKLKVSLRENHISIQSELN